jgi:transcriptional regulator of acetoin/glycerol metabolism
MQGPSELDETQPTNGLTLRQLEAAHIRNTLRRCHGNRTAAARELGINPSTLFRKLRSQKLAASGGNGHART